jgi:RNA polymerase sigma-70 factor (ECF subfamily)
LVDSVNNLVRLCQEKKPSAQRELYDMFKSKMFGICLRYADDPEDARDILQDGFIKVFEKIHQFGFKGAFEGWMRRIFVNTALERFRMRHNKMSLNDNLMELHETQAKEIEADIDARELLRLVQELSPQYRTVFNLYAIEGYSHKEISEMLQITEGTSKSNLSRARTILQEKVSRFYLKVQTT